MEILESLHDFIWYKNILDAKKKYHHKHYGEPIEYPCKIYSKWEESHSMGGYDCYYHSFDYQQEVVCDKCGHETIIWPPDREE